MVQLYTFWKKTVLVLKSTKKYVLVWLCACWRSNDWFNSYFHLAFFVKTHFLRRDAMRKTSGQVSMYSSSILRKIFGLAFSDVLGAPKPRNPRRTSPKVWSPNPTRPWKAEPEPTPRSVDPKFYLKNPQNPENPNLLKIIIFWIILFLNIVI